MDHDVLVHSGMVELWADRILTTWKRPGLLVADVRQELWVLLINCAEQHDPEQSAFSTYFYRAATMNQDRIVARAMGYNGVGRWRFNEKHLSTFDDGAAIVSVVPAPTPEPLDILEARETRSKVRRDLVDALDMIPLEQRQAVEASARGLSQKAMEANVPRRSYYDRVNRGRAKLRDLLCQA